MAHDLGRRYRLGGRCVGVGQWRAMRSRLAHAFRRVWCWVCRGCFHRPTPLGDRRKRPWLTDSPPILALARARPVVGGVSLCVDANRALINIISTKRDPAKISEDLLSMQARIQKEYTNATIWRLKHHSGGLMDLEFICQYLKLCHAHEHPDIMMANTIDSFAALEKVGILSGVQTTILTEAMSLYLNLQGLIRLSLKDRIVTDEIPVALKNALAAAGKTDDFDALQTKLAETENEVSRIFTEIVGSPTQ